jgi:hypothetical protein
MVLTVPEEFVAVTEKVYEVPEVSPVTVQSFGPADQVQVRPSGLEVTV